MARQNCRVKFTRLSQLQLWVQQLPVPTNPVMPSELHTNCSQTARGSKYIWGAARNTGVWLVLFNGIITNLRSPLLCFLINHLPCTKLMAIFPESEFCYVKETFPPFLSFLLHFTFLQTLTVVRGDTRSQIDLFKKKK